ncbi:MAG: metallophosphoesterase [Candidatus Bathyarchaeota archaeon]|nr:MAG: metallophosphoesterase [Candidatus Bathyarchaeota archaeon]
MIVGIMADTHDHLPLVDKAVKRLNDEKVELVFHAGDYIAGFVIPHFKSLEADLIGILGNNDGDHELLRKKFKEAGFEMRESFAEVRTDSLRIAILHGGDAELLHSLIDAESHDVIVHGHTHEARIHRKGKSLVVNPGEVCGYVTGKSTIATLNTGTLNVKIIPLG